MSGVDEKRIVVRVDPETWERYDNKRHAQRLSFQQLGETLLRNWYEGEGAVRRLDVDEVSGDSIPIPKGRIDDFADLAAILTSSPDGPIFNALDSVLKEALNEYRRNWKPQPTAPKKKTARKSSDDQRKATGT